MNMRYFLYSIITVLLLSNSVALAHPAKEIILKYDNDTKLLSIRIAHDSKDFNKHFIEKVWVSVNKKETVVQGFSSQDDLEKLELQYKIFNLKIGDVISADTKCNIFGKKAASLTIE